jgi:hypothetical protein
VGRPSDVAIVGSRPAPVTSRLGAQVRLGARSGPLLAAGILALLAIPLTVAVVVLRHPRWYPIWDQATTELQLRDVGTRHTPLTGVGGLLGLPEDPQGSHPGPLSFYLMWPVYRLLGSSSWAMQAAAAWVNLAALGVTVWLVSRRKSTGLLVGTAAALALLAHAYGPEALTRAWAPYLPILWWVAFMVAIWCVLCDDLLALPVAVLAGCVCVQTHSSYVFPVVGLLALALAGVWLGAYQRRHEPGSLRRPARWSLAALGVGVALWIPPVLEQLISPRGNLGILWRHFRGWNDEPMGLQEAVELILLHLNPWRLVTREMFFESFFITGSLIPGALMLIAWAVAAVAATRLGNRALVRLHVVVAAALLLAVATTSRLGAVYSYRVVWLWGVAVLLLLATEWTVALLAGRLLRSTAGEQASNLLIAVPVTLAIVFTATFAVNAAGVEYDQRDAEVLSALVPQVESALERVDPSAPYLLVWNDTSTGDVSRALVNELDRDGFDVNAPKRLRAEVRPHRVALRSDVEAVLVVTGGAEIELWAAMPGVRQITDVGVTGAQQATFSDDRQGTAVFLAPPSILREARAPLGLEPGYRDAEGSAASSLSRNSAGIGVLPPSFGFTLT